MQVFLGLSHLPTQASLKPFGCIEELEFCSGNISYFFPSTPCLPSQKQPLEMFSCNFIKKEALANVFSCEFCEISKNTFFTDCLWTTASSLSIFSYFQKTKIYKKKKIAITLMQGLSKAFVDEDLLKELYLEVIFSFYELFISAIYLYQFLVSFLIFFKLVFQVFFLEYLRGEYQI